MKKTILTLAILTTIVSLCHAQDQSGLGTILYDATGTITQETTTTPAVLLNNISFELVKTHLKLANIADNASPEEDMLKTLKTTEDLAKTDILEALRLSNDRQKTLSDYISNCNIALADGESTLMLLQQELSLLKLDMDACQVDKDAADKLYFEWVNNYDQTSATQALDASINNDKCASEKRIESNAKTYILNTLGFYQGMLQAKYDLIFNEQETLVQHSDVIDDATLTKLNTINETLKLYQPE